MNWLKNIYKEIKLAIHYRRVLKQIRKRDPYLYK